MSKTTQEKLTFEYKIQILHIKVKKNISAISMRNKRCVGHISRGLYFKHLDGFWQEECLRCLLKYIIRILAYQMQYAVIL